MRTLQLDECQISERKMKTIELVIVGAQQTLKSDGNEKSGKME